MVLQDMHYSHAGCGSQVACLSGDKTALSHCTLEELLALESTLGTARCNLRHALDAAQASAN